MSVASIPAAPVSFRDVRLTTPRLLLREHRLDDAESVLAYAADPEVLRFREATPATREQVQNNLARIDTQRAEEPRRLRYELAIVTRAEDRLIGWLPLLLGDRLAQADAEIGWTLARAYWGQGFATEAAAAVLRFAFETLCLHRVWARCQPENSASRSIMEKIGMRQEAHLRENQWVKGRWIDTLQYALLDHEWWAAQREPLPGQFNES